MYNVYARRVSSRGQRGGSLWTDSFGGTEKMEEKGSAQFSLHIVQTIAHSQTQNGLMHQNYHRYRQYCARRLRRLRKSLNMLHGRKEFKPRDIAPEEVVNASVLLIPLYNAERAWSYAMQLSQENDNEEQPRKVHHLHKRLRKAANWSEKLLQLCNAVSDTKTILEAEAYSAWMFGNLFWEKKMISEALERYVVARSSYERLAEIASRDQTQLFQDRVKMIHSNIRLCQYIEGDFTESTTDLKALMAQSDQMLNSKMEKILEENRVKEVEALDEVEFCGDKIPIKNEKVKSSLVSSNEAQAELEAYISDQKDISDDEIERLYGLVVLSLEAALSETDRELQELNVADVRTDVTERQEAELRQLHLFVKYTLLKALINRNEHLANKLISVQKEGIRSARSDDIVFIHEKLAEDIQELLDLFEKALGNEASILRDTLNKSKGLRYYYRAEGYKSIAKWAEAFALYDRSIAFFAEVSSADSQEYACKAEAAKLVVQAQGFLERIYEGRNESSVGEITKLPLTERLDHFVAADRKDKYNLTDFPPKFQKMPNKPVLFDLAWDQVQFRDVSKRLEKKKSFWSFWS